LFGKASLSSVRKPSQAIFQCEAGIAKVDCHGELAASESVWISDLPQVFGDAPLLGQVTGNAHIADVYKINAHGLFPP